MDSEGKLNKKIEDLEADYDELKEKYDGTALELDDLKGCIIQEHTNDFQKGLRQTTFFYQDVDTAIQDLTLTRMLLMGSLLMKTRVARTGKQRRKR